jgi:hypothetical protein
MASLFQGLKEKLVQMEYQDLQDPLVLKGLQVKGAYFTFINSKCNQYYNDIVSEACPVFQAVKGQWECEELKDHQ